MSSQSIFSNSPLLYISDGPNGMQCSGSGRGVCVCGTCECQRLTVNESNNT